MHIVTTANRFLIGAPKANTTQPGVTSGGAVYTCDVTTFPAARPCLQIPFDKTGRKYI